MRARSGLELSLRGRIGQHPDETWLKFGTRHISWSEALSNVHVAANGLLELGVGPGSRVGLMMANRPEFAWLYLGSVFIGAQIVPFNTSQRGATLSYLLADSDVSVVVAENALAPLVMEAEDRCPRLEHVVVMDSGPRGGSERSFEQLMSGPDTEPDVDLEVASGGIAMLYTSGTTGPPKGVVSLAPDFSSIMALSKPLEVAPGETVYSCWPFFHGSGLIGGLVTSILTDTRLAVAPRFSASRFWDDVRAAEAVNFTMIGGTASILLKQPPTPADRDHSVRTVLSAGMPADKWEIFEKRFGVRVVEYWGTSDSPGFLLNDEGRIGSVGRPVGEVEFAVVDDTDERLGPGEVGELLMKHPRGQLTEYYHQPEATAKAYRGGWFHTGDLFETDEEGYFYYRGRKTQSIRRLGENISAWEIETVLGGHPDILECAAFGVPSEVGEDDVMVVLVRRPGARIGVAAVADFCVGRIAPYAIPRYVEFADSIPKTPSQRPQYLTLRARGITEATWDRAEAAGQAGAKGE